MKLFSTLLIVFSLLSSFTTYATVVISNGLTHIHEGAQGRKIRGTIEVKNIGELPEKIIVSKQDLLKYCDPQSPDNIAPLNHDRSLNNWVELNVLEKELAPGEEFSVLYDITVPANEALEGSYWTMIIVEISRPIKRNQMDHGFMIDSKIRYGIQVITNIGNNLDTNKGIIASQDTQEGDSTAVSNMDSISDSNNVAEVESTDSTSNEILIDSAIVEIDSLLSSDSSIVETDSLLLNDSTHIATIDSAVINSNEVTETDSTTQVAESGSDEESDDEYEDDEYEDEEEGENLLEFIGLKLDKREGVQFIYTKLENYDIYLMNIAIIIDIYDENAELVKRIESPLKKLYPSSCVEFEIPLEEILPGEYDAVIVADYGKDLYGINVSLTIDAE